jgi:hypothetical protein
MPERVAADHHGLVAFGDNLGAALLLHDEAREGRVAIAGPHGVCLCGNHLPDERGLPRHVPA